MAFTTKTDFSRGIIQHSGTSVTLSGSTNILSSFSIKNIELDVTNITYGESLIYDGLKLKAGTSGNFKDRVVIGMGLNVNPINALNYNVGLGQYIIGGTQYFYSGGSININNGNPTLSRFDIIYITSSNTASVLMGTSATSPITPTLSSGELNLGIILVAAGYYSGSTSTTIFTPTTNNSPFRYYSGFTSAIERSDGNSNARNNFSMALSRNSRVTGQDSIAMGLGTKSNTDFQTSLGNYNNFDSNALLIIGYGDSDINRKNALTIDFSGNTKISNKLYVDTIQIDTTNAVSGSVLTYDGNKFTPILPPNKGLGIDWDSYLGLGSNITGGDYYNGLFYFSNNDSGNGIITSPDGKLMTFQNTPTGDTTIWYDVKGANGTLIAVGKDGNYNVMRSINNGNTWSYVTSSVSTTNNKHWRRVTTNGNGIWMACAFENPTIDNIMVSVDDGLTWVRKNLPVSCDVTNIWYGDGYWFCTKYDSIGGIFRSTDNGNTWVLLTIPSTIINTISGMYANGICYAVSQNGGSDGVAISSDKGNSWTTLTTIDTGNQYLDITYGDGVSIIFSRGSNFLYSKDNALTWNLSNATNNSPIAGLKGIYGNGVFVIRDTYSNYIQISGKLIDNIFQENQKYDIFLTGFTVSLNSGKTFGKYLNGTFVPAQGKTAKEVILMAAIEDIYPTYNVAAINLAQSQPTIGEVGESLSNTIVSTFNQNDAGSLTNIRIQKNGFDITPNGSTSPFSKIDSAVRILGSISYQGFCNYNAGSLKNITPSGLPDDRTPQIRNSNTPQAAENNFASNVLSLTGYYKIFYGNYSSAPNSSSAIRASLQNRFTNSSNNFILNTGTSNIIFAIWMPNSNSLVSVFDLQSSSADITSTFVLSSLSVNDAGGNSVSGKLYTATNSIPYTINHQFSVTIS